MLGVGGQIAQEPESRGGTVNSCFLVTWISHTSTQSNLVGLQKACTRSSQPKFQHGRGGELKDLLLSVELLEVMATEE